jgi:hypothetical protein
MKVSHSIRTGIALKSPFSSLPACVFVLAALASAIVSGDELPAPSASSTEQAQAREFGIFFGGTATQFDLCVKKGLLPKGDRSAADIAESIIRTMQEHNREADQSAFVQEGWDYMKSYVAAHESQYTREKCAWVGGEWAKMVKTMTQK